MEYEVSLNKIDKGTKLCWCPVNLRYQLEVMDVIESVCLKGSQHVGKDMFPREEHGVERIWIIHWLTNDPLTICKLRVKIIGPNFSFNKASC